VFTNTGRGADGQGGDITIKTATLQILNGAVLSTTTQK
jgi:large exoprotein involved in heme utilization and adhesion